VLGLYGDGGAALKFGGELPGGAEGAVRRLDRHNAPVRQRFLAVVHIVVLQGEEVLAGSVVPHQADVEPALDVPLRHALVALWKCALVGVEVVPQLDAAAEGQAVVRLSADGGKHAFFMCHLGHLWQGDCGYRACCYRSPLVNRFSVYRVIACVEAGDSP